MLIVGCVASDVNYKSDPAESRRSSRIISNTYEILKLHKDLDSNLEEKFIYLQSFIKFNNDNIRTIIREELKNEYDKWSKIVHEKCIVSGHLSKWD
jgi:hypothetical protein